jgi:hypothetical protein
MPVDPFSAVAPRPDATLDELALALAGEFREVDSDRALEELDRLGADLAPAAGTGPEAEEKAIRHLLGRRHGFIGDREDYYHPTTRCSTWSSSGAEAFRSCFRPFTSRSRAEPG